MEDKKTKTKIEQHVIDFVTRLRVDHHLDQSDIATIIETGRTFVTNVENPENRAKYNLRHINLIADHFGISPKDFMPAKAFKSKQSH